MSKALEAIKNLQESSEILKQPLEDQQATLLGTLLPAVVRTTLMSNPVVKVVCLEDLAQAVAHTLQSQLITSEFLKENFKEELTIEGEELDKVVRDLNNVISKIPIEPNKIGSFIPNDVSALENVSPLEVFIRLITHSDLMNAELSEFLNNTGVGEFVQNSKISWSPQELRMAYIMFVAFSLAIQNGQRAQNNSLGAPQSGLLRP